MKSDFVWISSKIIYLHNKTLLMNVL